MTNVLRKLRKALLGPIWLAVMILVAKGSAGEDSQWQRPLPQDCPYLYCWTDTCNVYVLKDGESAILIDLGDGIRYDRQRLGQWFDFVVQVTPPST